MTAALRIPGFLMVISILVACASQPEYRPAEQAGDYGYSEEQIDEDQYRIVFRTRGDDLARAVDYAMLRASEIALEQDYDWIAITSRDTRVDTEQVGPQAMFGPDMSQETVRSCGLLGCRDYSRPLPPYQMGMPLGDESSEVEVSLTVRLGTGIRPTEVESFDAREVYADLGS